MSELIGGIFYGSIIYLYSNKLVMTDKSFVHLHNHSEFSFIDGSSLLPSMASICDDLKMPAIALDPAVRTNPAGKTLKFGHREWSF